MNKKEFMQPIILPQYKCPICSKELLNTPELLRHLVEHCGGVLTMKKGLTRVCPGCHKGFARYTGIFGHLEALYREGKLLEHIIGAAAEFACGGQQHEWKWTKDIPDSWKLS